MQPPSLESTTALLLAANRGDGDALQRLFTTVYDELRAIAGRIMIRRDGTLQPTALVHEAWLRLVDQTRVSAKDRAHFVRIAARAMRFSMRDHWRSGQADKRGAGVKPLPLLDHEPAQPLGDPDAWLCVDEAMTTLATVDPELEQIAELRLFGGLEHGEIATCLGTSLRSVERGWRSARAFLVRAIDGQDEPGAEDRP